METAFLEKLGLSRNEAKTYRTLLKIGKANSAELARESGIHRINVYDVLNSLIAKGLVSYVSESGRRIFKAESPAKLEQFLDEKMAMLQQHLPEMLTQFNSKREKYEVTLLRGIEGKKSQFEEIIRTARNTITRVFIPHGFMVHERAPYNTKLRGWYEKLAKQNVEAKILSLDTVEARKRGRLFKGIPNNHIRFSKEVKFSPVSWNVCNELVFLTFQTDPYLIIRIKSREIANSFKNSFEIMWKAAKR